MHLYFLKMDGVPSKSNYAHHAHWMECDSFNFKSALPFGGESRPVKGNLDIERDLVDFTLLWGRSSVILHQMYGSGQRIASAVLEIGLKNGDVKFTLKNRVRMTNVTVDSAQVSGSSAYFTLSCAVAFEFEFGSATQLYLEQRLYFNAWV